MEELLRVEASNPPLLATADQIQRRLIRPLSPQSQPPIPIITTSSTRDELRKQSNVDLKANMAIEDYLDPALLSIARAKIGGTKRKSNWREMKGSRKYDHFEYWPADGIKVSNEVSNTKHRREAGEAVDLGRDTDFTGDDGFALK